jgi:hypothetical protein
VDWKRTDVLSADQTDHPVQYIGELYGVELPPIDARWCLEFWGDSKRTSRFKTFGHRDGKQGPHFIVARGGTSMHTDIGFMRWSVHVQLYNGGYYTHGLDTDPANYELLVPGVITVLDTHSPHKVSRDPRLEQRSPSKVAMAVDFDDYPPSVDHAVDQLVAWLPSLAVPA